MRDGSGFHCRVKFRRTTEDGRRDGRMRRLNDGPGLYSCSLWSAAAKPRLSHTVTQLTAHGSRLTATQISLADARIVPRRTPLLPHARTRGVHAHLWR